jgi:phenylalanyl-tRNA synthetase beta chain
MVGLGFTECVTFGFIPEESPDVLGAPADSPLRSSVRLLKPLTKDQSIMRTSLRPGLLMTMQYNISRGVEYLKLFEWGKVFFHVDGEELPTEKLSLTAAMTGLFVPQTCHSKARPVDFFDVKGVLDSFLQGLGHGRPSYERGDIPPGYDPDFSATVSMAGIALGTVGRVAPEVMERYDMASTEAYIMELDLESLIRAVPCRPVFRPFPKYPAVFRDLTVIVHKKVESARITELIEKQGGNLVESVRMLDLYEGDRMASSEKALTYRIAYRSQEGTLDGVAVNRIHEGIIERIHKETGGRLPGS